MQNKYSWLEKYKKETECVDGEFGHNCEFGFLKAFKKLDKLVDGKIDLEDYYTAKIILPKDPVDTLIFIMCTFPGCSRCVLNKNELKLEWHF